jgi:hypothetical protein
MLANIMHNVFLVDTESDEQVIDSIVESEEGLIVSVVLNELLFTSDIEMPRPTVNY